MKQLISGSFAVGAMKDSVSIDHIENYYLCEATGNTPAVNDSRWKKVADGGTVPVPTSTAPFLWHKYIVVLTDGSKKEPIIEFKGSLGKNGIDYDLVPSHTSIVKKEDGSVAPANVTCAMIMRNADGTAQTLSAVPAGYSIVVLRDNASQAYSLGSNVSTANVNVITFIMKYGSVEVERHDIRVITEGAQGIAGRGIQSQDIRFKAQTSATKPAVPTNDTSWNTWQTLANVDYSASKPYLYKCVKTVFVDGNGTTSTEYYIEGPTVWGQDGKTPFVVDIDNEMTAIAVNSEGKLAKAVTLSFGLKAFYGTDNVLSSCEVYTVGSLPAGFTADAKTDKAHPTVTVAANTTPTELTEITFRVKHATYGERDVVFSIAAVKSGGVGDDAVIYQLLPSDSELSVARTEAGGYTPSTVSLTCGYTKRKGNAEATSVLDVTGAFDGYNIYFRRYNRTTGWETTWRRYYSYKSYLSSLNVSTYSKVEFVLCKATAISITSLSGQGVIDRETVPVIADGLNGASPFILDLSNDMSSVALTDTGVTAAKFEETFSLKAFYGTTDVTGSLTTVGSSVSPANNNISIDSSDVAAIKVTIPAGKALDATTEIIFTCTHPTYGTRTVTHILAGVRAGADGKGATIYELLPDLTQVAFTRDSNNNLTPSYRSVNVSIKKVQGETVTIQTISASGLTVRYSFSSMPSSASDGTSLTTSSITVYPSYSNLYIAAFKNGTLIDRETIPVVKDGAKGGTGDSGAGVSKVSYYRLFTQSFEAPAVTASWKGRDDCKETDLSATQRYLWEKKVTTYTKNVSDSNEIYLVAQFASSPCANLLEDTAFLSEAEMEAWEEKHGSLILPANTGMAQNGWQLNPDVKEQYVEMLKQKVFDSNIKKIKPNTWYTLSFWAAQASSITLFSGSTYNGDGGGGYYQIAKSLSYFRIEPGQTVTIQFTGRVNNASSGILRAWAWLNSLDMSQTWLSGGSVSADIKTTYNSTVTLKLTNNQSNACMAAVAGYMIKTDGSQVDTAYTAYRGYCTKVTIDRGSVMHTYLYRSGNSNSAIATNEPWYVDGQKVTNSKTLDDGTNVTHSADGCVAWKLTPTPTRHSVTFKTSNFSSSSTDAFRVLFRLMTVANYGWVSMPKLEENTMATEWSENSKDRYANEIGHMYVGEWRASTEGDASTYYLYALGVRHVVRAKESANGAMVYFRMKEKTTSTGYCSLKEPYSDTQHWEKANYLRFVAADLVLADEVITDKLTVSKLKAANDHFTIDDEGNVTANGGTFNNITVRSGDDNGQRVEIDPESKNVAIFDSENNQCTSIDGNTYSLKDLIPSVEGSTFTLQSTASRSRGVKETVVIAGGLKNTYQLTSSLQTTKPAKVKMDYSGAAVSFYFKSESYDTKTPITAFTTVELFFVIKTYSDSGCTRQIGSSYNRICFVTVRRGETASSTSYSNINSVSVPAGYHKLFAEVRISASNTSEICELTTYWNFSSVKVVVDSFISRYFANGLALSKNNLNYIALYEEDGYMNFAAASDGKVFKMEKGQLSVDGAVQPVVVYAAKVTDTSNSKTEIQLSPLVLSQIASGVVVRHTSSEGIYRVVVPGSFGVTASNALVRATGYGSVAGGSYPVKACVSDMYWSGGYLYINIKMSDDYSPNYGGFFIEILRY